MVNDKWSIKIISGGQSGADRAATDFAIENDIAYGGWIPKGRLAEDGKIPLSYSSFKETKTPVYSERTQRNVTDSDGTLLVSHGQLSGGTLLTSKIARRESKPLLHIDLDLLSFESAVSAINPWIRETPVIVLNVAGPRASKDPLIYYETKELLTLLFV